jgi:hypothetical protein
LKTIIISCGRPYQWEQIAIAVSRAGLNPTLASWSPDILEKLKSMDTHYDVVITTRYVLAEIHNYMVRQGNNDLFGLGTKFVVVQYDDIISEIFVVSRVQEAFQRFGLKHRCVLWTYCEKSYAFIKKHEPGIECIYGSHPIYGNCRLDVAGASGRNPYFCEDVLQHTIRINDNCFVAGFGRKEFSEKLVFLGNVPDKLPPWEKFGFRSSDEINDIILPYVSRNPDGNTLHFVEYMIGEGLGDMNSNNIAKTMYLVWQCAQHYSREARVKYARQLKKEYGDRFVVYGAGWEKYGVPALPANQDDALLIYGSAAACVDLGSIYIEACVYQRSIEILGMGGRIIQKRHHDTDKVYGLYSPLASFRDVSDIINIINLMFARPDDMAKVNEEMLHYVYAKLDGDRAILPLINWIKGVA